MFSSILKESLTVFASPLFKFTVYSHPNFFKAPVISMQAFSGETWTAVKFLIEDSMAFTPWACSFGVGGTEYCHNRGFDCAGYVHRSTIICDEKFAYAE